MKRRTWQLILLSALILALAAVSSPLHAQDKSDPAANKVLLNVWWEVEAAHAYDRMGEIRATAGHGRKDRPQNPSIRLTRCPLWGPIRFSDNFRADSSYVADGCALCKTVRAFGYWGISLSADDNRENYKLAARKLWLNPISDQYTPRHPRHWRSQEIVLRTTG